MLAKWPEDRVKTVLGDRLRAEGWTVEEVHFGTERGKDLAGSRGDRKVGLPQAGSDLFISLQLAAKSRAS